MSPKQLKNGYLRYQVLLAVSFPLLIIYTIYLAFKYRSSDYLFQRTGLFTKPDQPVDIWLHAASVGEVNAAFPLVKAIQEIFPHKKFLVTTVTQTGATVFRQRKLHNAVHQYLPLDYRFMVSRLLRKHQPKCVLIMETEIWPNLFRLCRLNNIPLCTVNGRLSNKTLDTGGWIRSLLRSALQYSSLILTRSDNDTKAYIALGADPEKTKTVGNIKFSIELDFSAKPSIDLGRPFVLAASTHSDEELTVAKLWKQKSLNKFNHLLVIVPRHPHRLKEILEQLCDHQFNIAVRSRNDNIANSTDIYIVDTVGELTGFMASAEFIFMGGSLVPIGGHNILEPAALGKPMVFGPYMENFDNEAEMLAGFGAAIQVENIEQLGDTLQDALQHSEKYAELGVKAKHIVEQYKDTASRYVAELKEYLDSA